MTKRILITGGAGFIGSRLTELLAGENEVYVYDNLLKQVHEHNPQNAFRSRKFAAKFIRGDVRNLERMNETVLEINPHVVFHLAAETGTGQSFDEIRQYTAANVIGTVSLIEAIRANGPSVEKVILASSRSVYGEGAYVNSKGEPSIALPRSSANIKNGDFNVYNAKGEVLIPAASNAETFVAPASIYASTKLMQEELLSQAFWGSGIDVGILRLQNVYGAGQSLYNPYTGVISIMIKQLLDGQSLNIYEDGEITRDFVHVTDVVTAFEAAMNANLDGGIIDIGSGQSIKILDLAKMLMAKLDLSTDNYKISGDFRAGDIRNALADISAANTVLGWQPKRTLDNGLNEIVKWSRKIQADQNADGATSENQAQHEVVGIYSWPKTGNTWLRAIVAGIMGMPDDKFTLHKYIMDTALVSQNTNHFLDKRWRVGKTDFSFYKSHHKVIRTSFQDRTFKTDKVLYIYRFPLDAFVSYVNFVSQNVAPESGKGLPIQFENIDDLTPEQFSVLFDIFLESATLFPNNRAFGGIFEHFHNFKRIAKNQKPVLFIKYEDLKTEFDKNVAAIADFLEMENVDIAEVKAYSEEMTKPNGKFFWKRKSGTYRDYLSAEQINKFLDKYSAELRDMGYDPEAYRPS